MFSQSRSKAKVIKFITKYSVQTPHPHVVRMNDEKNGNSQRQNGKVILRKFLFFGGVQTCFEDEA
jgi:hypothetical protein